MWCWWCPMFCLAGSSIPSEILLLVTNCIKRCILPNCYPLMQGDASYFQSFDRLVILVFGQTCMPLLLSRRKWSILWKIWQETFHPSQLIMVPTSPHIYALYWSRMTWFNKTCCLDKSCACKQTVNLHDLWQVQCWWLEMAWRQNKRRARTRKLLVSGMNAILCETVVMYWCHRFLVARDSHCPVGFVNFRYELGDDDMEICYWWGCVSLLGLFLYTVLFSVCIIAMRFKLRNYAGQRDWASFYCKYLNSYVTGQ